MFGKSFHQCPMYSRSGDAHDKIRDMDRDIRTLSMAHKVTSNNQDLMMVDIADMKNSLLGHMDDEAEHHDNTNKTLTQLTNTVNELIKAQAIHQDRIDARETQKAKDKEDDKKLLAEKAKEVRSFFWKLAFWVTVILTTAIGSFMWKSINYYHDATQMQKLQKHLYGVDKFEEGKDD